ncbi:MAG: response regulator [Desulfobacteraceae bacterium]|nr:response regulator [Desulfobacteraceae bacterium]
MDLLEQVEDLLKIGYFERNWQSGEGYYSNGFFKLLGYNDMNEVPSHNDFSNFVDKKDRQKFKKVINESLANKSTINIEYKLNQKCGDSIIVQQIGITDYDENDNPLLSKGILQNISERKKAEKKYNEIQKKLIQASKMEAIGRLAGGIAHDFNNMTQVIIGYTEMVMQDIQENDPIYKDLSEILEAAKRSAKITSQLLAFSRQQPINPKPIDLNNILENHLKVIQRVVGENINISWIPEKNLWPIKIDSTQFNQIITNLCINARDAIVDVGEIIIETKNMSIGNEYFIDNSYAAPGKYAMFSLSDTGEGIEKENINKIFEPFYTTKDVGKGTGLGLSTVYGIVKQNSGFINAYSEIGHGTTFKIYFPKADKQTLEKENIESSNIPLGSEETILLVEDDPSILRLCKKLIESLGYNVLASAGPIEALKLNEKYNGNFDLLITDVIMPKMNGNELCKKIQEKNHIKTLFMSGYTANVIVNKGVLKEGINFIQKPFSKKELASKIREVLNKN